MELITKSAQETKNFGKKIADSLKGGETFALVGDLGSGKTTFVQGLASGLGIDQRIISPTYIIMRKYDVPLVHQPKGVKFFYHVDLYRLDGAIESELKNIGIDEILEKRENVVCIEWADKVTGLLPKNSVWIEFENIGEDNRKIKLKK